MNANNLTNTGRFVHFLFLIKFGVTIAHVSLFTGLWRIDTFEDALYATRFPAGSWGHTKKTTVFKTHLVKK